MKGKNIAVVIPTIRNLDFLRFWKNEFKDCIGIIVEDHKDKEIKLPDNVFKKVYHYSWKDIDRTLGKNSWIIPRKNAGIRSFGFFKAYNLNAEIIVTLDDDCYPLKNQSFIKTHLENLSLFSPKDWYPTYPNRKHLYTRGFPYSVRDKYEVVLSHGLWTNSIDHDAQTLIKNGNLKVKSDFDFVNFIPKNYFFPMCSMNMAFKKKITPLMYFPLMGYDQKGNHWGYDRFDDIWAGILAKRVLDNMNLGVINGSPFVKHKQKSNLLNNLKKEGKALKINETLYKRVKDVALTSKDINSAYLELIEKIRFPKSEYFGSLKKAMKIWISLFKE